MSLRPSQRLIIFTRYPEPGKTKTRLIPALGAAGAADLQRQMTEHTVAQARQWRQLAGAASPVLTGQLTEQTVGLGTQSSGKDKGAIALEVRFAGGNRQLMQDWLGTDLLYEPQGEGDLGDRMLRAFQESAAKGTERTVIIGIDCPEIDAGLLQKAFQALAQQSLVLGPAMDGGYYLIGLNQPIPSLFSGIAWGTETVLSQTVEQAERLKLQRIDLPMLGDVDRPDDLGIWQRARSAESTASTPIEISAIVPTLNEAGSTDPAGGCRLAQVLDSLCHLPNVETIVVDGGSEDETVEIAKAHQVCVIRSACGRAQQMNAGAAAARGDILLFLHGDTLLPEDFVAQVRQTLAHPDAIAGAFELKIEGDLPGLRTIERWVRWRSRRLQMPYGDQAIFLRAETFRTIGGFPKQPLMEDFELVRQLRRQGRIAIAPGAVLTSGRRWQQLGVWQTTVINQLIVLAYFLGVPTARLARWYRRSRRGKGTSKLTADK